MDNLFLKGWYLATYKTTLPATFHTGGNMNNYYGMGTSFNDTSLLFSLGSSNNYTNYVGVTHTLIIEYTKTSDT